MSLHIALMPKMRGHELPLHLLHSDWHSLSLDPGDLGTLSTHPSICQRFDCIFISFMTNAKYHQMAVNVAAFSRRDSTCQANTMQTE